AALLRAVLLAHARGAVVAISGLDSSAVEGVDLLARVGDEREVDRAARLGIIGDHPVRELGPALALPDRRDPERLEDGLVERDTRGGVADPDVDVVEDDARP